MNTGLLNDSFGIEGDQNRMCEGLSSNWPHKDFAVGTRMTGAEIGGGSK